MQTPVALTVLYDDHCPFCVWCKQWLERSTQLVPLRLLSCHDPIAKQWSHPNVPIGNELVVVADDGFAWTGPAAFLMCMWALDAWRPLAWLFVPVWTRWISDLAFLLVTANRVGLGRLLGLPTCKEGHCALPVARGAYR
jgi:predicted DCC family thiol-disulfide oxidoreductase YuxK